MWVIYLCMLFGHQLNTYLHVVIVLLTVGTGENVDKEKDCKPHGKTNPPVSLRIFASPYFPSLFSSYFIGNMNDVVDISLISVL